MAKRESEFADRLQVRSLPGASVADIIGMALFALRGNWLRSVLTALGVIIGIAAVIVMMSVGQGTKAELERTISRLGSNRIDITPNFGRMGGVRTSIGSVFSLTDGDADAVREKVAGAQFVSGQLRGNIQVIHAEQNWSTQWYGVEADFFRINGWEFARGEEFTPGDYAAAGKVVLIGSSVREKLFADADPIGATIRVGRVPFRVVGEMRPKGQSAWGGDQDDVIFVPLNTARRRLSGQISFPPGMLSQTSVGASGVADIPRVQREIETLLRERHRIGPGADDDFVVRNLTEIVNARSQTTRLMSMLLAAVATISLIVGGIGIMNIMLVSVTERIREIGLRMAIGAGPRQIQQQFLAEAMMISLGGGIVGIGLGVVGTLLAARFGSLPVELNVQVIALATGFSVATGLFFGFYPARKAARLDPIEALRQQ